ncbi:MAG: type II secretion system protein [Verrucomicrobia bacterium]|nr:type II secretion system protein [Verrucomicrobiota bacterium]MCH8513089.1 type II secretion system GspH family protein [Kiritimatiellia bacterium]
MKRSGFTLIEMLVVIAILALLVSITVPAVGRTIERAQTTKCAAQLRQFHQAAMMYATTNRNRLPAVCDEQGFVDPATGNRGRFNWPGTWPFVLAEYLGLPDIQPGQRLDTPLTHTIFTCPSYRKSPAYEVWNNPYDRNLLGGYGMNRRLPPNEDLGNNWVGEYLAQNFIQSENPSARLLFADGSGRNGDLGTRFDFNSFGQANFQYRVDPVRHLGGANLCYLDGHVSFLREAVIVARGVTGALFYD